LAETRILNGWMVSAHRGGRIVESEDGEPGVEEKFGLEFIEMYPIETGNSIKFICDRDVRDAIIEAWTGVVPAR
jgi:hypothetical protein